MLTKLFILRFSSMFLWVFYFQRVVFVLAKPQSFTQQKVVCLKSFAARSINSTIFSPFSLLFVWFYGFLRFFSCSFQFTFLWHPRFFFSCLVAINLSVSQHVSTFFELFSLKIWRRITNHLSQDSFWDIFLLFLQFSSFCSLFIGA